MLIYFGVEGGFANQMRSITIADDGSAMVDISGTTSEKQLDSAAVKALVAQLEASGLFNQDRTYEASGADLQRFEIRYAGATVVGYDTSLPDELRPATAMLDAAIRS